MCKARNCHGAILLLFARVDNNRVKTPDRDQAIVKPALIGRDSGPDQKCLARLERAGVIRRAYRGRLEGIVRVLPPAAEPGGDIVAAIIKERRNGR